MTDADDIIGDHVTSTSAFAEPLQTKRVKISQRLHSTCKSSESVSGLEECDDPG